MPIITRNKKITSLMKIRSLKSSGLSLIRLWDRVVYNVEKSCGRTKPCRLQLIYNLTIDFD